MSSKEKSDCDVATVAYNAATPPPVQPWVPAAYTNAVGYSAGMVGNTANALGYSYDVTPSGIYIIEMEFRRVDTSYPSNPRLKFFSEEEFVLSFINLYNALQEGKSYAVTGDGVHNIQNVNNITLKNNINGIISLISPLYVLERAKEFGYV